MDIPDVTEKAKALCERQSLHFIYANLDGQNIYVHTSTRNGHGEVWAMRFDDSDNYILGECLFRFALDPDASAPAIPACISGDVERLHAYRRDHDQPGVGRSH